MHIFINETRIHIHAFSKLQDLGDFDVRMDLSSERVKYNKLTGRILINNPSIENIKELIFVTTQDKFENIFSITFLVKDEDLESIKQAVKSEFKIIEAAGGVVRKEDKVLLIYRLKKWDLPKGKMEKNESYKETAQREVEEECNIKISLNEKLCTTWHYYQQGKVNVLKKTKWYLMDCINDAQMKPQLEENIEQIVWMRQDEVKNALTNSYYSIQYVLEVYFKQLVA